MSKKRRKKPQEQKQSRAQHFNNWKKQLIHICNKFEIAEILAHITPDYWEVCYIIRLNKPRCDFAKFSGKKEPILKEALRECF